MKFHRIEPIPHETFYVLAEDGADLSKITNSSICFSPISYRMEFVEPGDIPTYAKIVTIGRLDGRIRRVNLEIALRLIGSRHAGSVNEVSVAIDALKDALKHNSLNASISIDLKDADQAARFTSLLGREPVPATFSRSRGWTFACSSDPAALGTQPPWLQWRDSLRSMSIRLLHRVVRKRSSKP